MYSAARGATFYLKRPEMTLRERLWHLSWSYVVLICLIACVGFAMLYSAANGNWDPWASRQMTRFLMGLALLIVLAVTDLRMWMRYAYAIYGVTLLLLVLVEVKGQIGMGAQRWINLGFFQLQPSEMMKIALLLALARYFHGLDLDEARRFHFMIPPLILLALPVALVLRQPDLGTALMLMMAAGILVFLAGARLWWFGGVMVAGLSAIPVAWQFLHDYQQRRVLTFLDPERDPLGAGYHILQSKITLGSGGLFGKGFLEGTQSHLKFLPEQQTDFIFTMLAEEFGLIGGLLLLFLYLLVLAYGIFIATRSRSHFGRLLAMGLTANFFLYMFINMAMVMGLIPVVGVPLPLISYGGTAMLTLMVGFGLIQCVHVNRDMQIGRRGAAGDDL